MSIYRSGNDERQSNSTTGASSFAHSSESSYTLQAWLNEKPHAGPWSSVIYHTKGTGEKYA